MLNDHLRTGPAIVLQRVPQLRDLRRVVGSPAYGFEEVGRAPGDDVADLRVGVENGAGRRRIPDGCEPRPIGDRHRRVIPGQRLVEHASKQRRLRAECGEDGGSGDAGGGRDIGQRGAEVTPLHEEFAGRGDDRLPCVPRALLAYRRPVLPPSAAVDITHGSAILATYSIDSDMAKWGTRDAEGIDSSVRTPEWRR